MKCPKCPRPTNRGLLFAFRDGQVIYACTKHAGVIKKDDLTDWMRVGKWRRLQ